MSGSGNFTCRDWVINLRVGLSPGEFRVLLNLGEYANADGSSAYPSIARLAADTELAERTVQGHLRSLALRGLIVCELKATQHRPATYRVCVGQGRSSCTSEPAQGCKFRHPGVQVSTSRGAASAPDLSSLTPSIDQPNQNARESRGSGGSDSGKASGRTTVAETWTPGPNARAYATRLLGDRAALEAERCRRYYRSTGQLRADWDLAFEAWCDKAAELKPTRTATGERTPRARANAPNAAPAANAGSEDPWGVAAAWKAFEADGGVPGWTLEGFGDVLLASGLPPSWRGNLAPLFDASLGRDPFKVMNAVAAAAGRFDGPTSSFARFVPAIEAAVERGRNWEGLQAGDAGRRARA